MGPPLLPLSILACLSTFCSPPSFKQRFCGSYSSKVCRRGIGPLLLPVKILARLTKGVSTSATESDAVSVVPARATSSVDGSGAQEEYEKNVARAKRVAALGFVVNGVLACRQMDVMSDAGIGEDDVDEQEDFWKSLD